MGIFKRIFDSWFDEKDWPHDPFLDPVRDSVWQLTLDGEHHGWLFTTVTPMRSFPFFGKQESVWATPFVRGVWPFLSDEDYGLDWHIVTGLLAGHFDHFDDEVGETRYEAQPAPVDQAKPLFEQFKTEFLERNYLAE